MTDDSAMTASNPIHGYHHSWEVQIGVGLLDGETESPTADAALRRADGWHPCRSYAAGHLWRSPAR